MSQPIAHLLPRTSNPDEDPGAKETFQCFLFSVSDFIVFCLRFQCFDVSLFSVSDLVFGRKKTANKL